MRALIVFLILLICGCQTHANKSLTVLVDGGQTGLSNQQLSPSIINVELRENVTNANVELTFRCGTLQK